MAFLGDLAWAQSLSIPQPAPDNPPSWLGSIAIGGRIEVGATMNPSGANGNLNFGRLYTDKTNQLVLNQFALTVERAIDPHADRLDLGFHIDASYGLDSQFNHFQGVGDQGSTSRNSFDINTLTFDAHLTTPFIQGVDVKAGFFPSPMGSEAIDPTRNTFYSRSYIFDFGLPRKHTGVLTTTHVRPDLDVYLGYTTGVNASLGRGGGYNDAQPHLLGGFGLDLGQVNVVAYTHMGPEDRPAQLPLGTNAHDRWRYIGDLVVNWRVSPRLTSVTEFNYVRDDGLAARAGGASETLTYQIAPGIGAAARAEVWRDAQGVFVAAYPGNLDYLNAEEGRPNGAYRAGPATYAEVTLGLNLKVYPLLGFTRLPMDSPFGALTFRPEIRYDRALSGVAPFGGRPGVARDQVTVGLDVVAPLLFTKTGPKDPGERAQPVPAEAASQPAFSGGTHSGWGATLALFDDRPMTVSRLLLRDSETPAPKGAETLEDLSGVAPGLRIVRAASGPGALSISLRGLGEAEPRAGQTPAIGLSLDGVGLGAGIARIIDLFDVAAVEVVRGPSGVDDGDAALGGMIRVERARPTRQWGLAGGYSFEQGYHGASETLLLNAPVGTTAGLSLFAAHGQRGGYLTNIATGDPLYGRDEVTTGAANFDWSLTPRLDVDLAVTLARQHGRGAPLSLGDALDARLLGPALAARTPGLAFNGYGSPYLPGRTTPLEPWQSANTSGDGTALTAQIYSVKAAYDLPAGRISSTTAYSREHEGTAQDLDGGCVGAASTSSTCPILANPLVGYLQSDRHQTDDWFSQDVRIDYRLLPLATVAAGLSYAHETLSADRLTLSSAGASTVGGSQTRDNRSAFVTLTASSLGRLRIEGGARYVDDQTHYRQQAGLNLFAGAQGAHHWLTRIAIDYRLAPGALVYADFATGFRPGGIAPDSTLSERIAGQPNFNSANPGAALAPYGLETTRTYEVGARITGLAGQISGDVAAYLTQDHNHQLTQTVLTPGHGPEFNTYVVNLPRVEMKGVEAEARLRPSSFPGLTLSVNAAYLDARILDGAVPGAQSAVNAEGLAGAPGSVFNLSGGPLPLSPRFTAAGRVDYSRPVGPGVVDLNLGYRWTSHYALANFAAQGDDQPAFGLLDMSLSYSRSFYKIIVSGRNLLNRAYLVSASPALFIHQWGDPRTAVVELQARF